MQAQSASLRDLDEARRQCDQAQVTLNTSQQRRTLLGEPVWAPTRRMVVSVPLYAGELASVDQKAECEVSHLGAAPDANVISAKPMGLLPTGDAARATLTLLYRLDAAWGFVPGQRVRLPIGKNRMSRTVPWAAVLYDISGGQWVYVTSGNGQYQRQRIAVRGIQNGIAFLDQGPQPGILVVTDGAAELFGTEFGVGH